MNNLKKRTDILDQTSFQVIQAKYASERINEIDLLQLDNKIKISILRLVVITGWAIPVNEMMQLFIDEFRTMLLQDYSDINFDEIIFAFRKYKNLVEDWGKEMNLKLISKVLDAYMEDRYDTGLLEERIKMDENKHIEFIKKEYSDDEIIQNSLNYWLNSSCPKIEFINPKCYDILTNQGKINLSEHEKNRIKNKAELLMEEYFTNLAELKKMKSNKEYKSLVCKKIAVSEYFKTLKNETIK